MVSRSEQLLSQALRLVLSELPVGGELSERDDRLYHFWTGLEFYLPQVLREIHLEWRQESLDGFAPIVARKVGDHEAELFGTCIRISDQRLAPIHLRLQVSSDVDQVAW